MFKNLKIRTGVLSTWTYLMLAIVSPFIAAAVVRDKDNIELRDGSIRSAATAGAPVGDPNVFASLAEKVVPTVVNITTRTAPALSNPLRDSYRHNFEQFFGFPGEIPGDSGPDFQTRSNRGQVALGSGVIIESNGNKSLVLTNHHVVKGATTITVQLDKSLGILKPLRGRIIGLDQDLDIALIEIESPKPLTALSLGDSNALRVGDYVMAVGNPFGQGHSVSHGIISAKERFAPTLLGQYLQTDAPINPGNSGGPLVDLQGRIVGINDAILAVAHGIGFAIPSNDIKQAVADLKQYGKVRRAFLGIQVGAYTDPRSELAAANGESDDDDDVDMNAEDPAAYPQVVAVGAGSPAERAGIRPTDVLVEFNGRKIVSVKDFLLSISRAPIGSNAKINLLRNGQPKEILVKLQERPSLES